MSPPPIHSPLSIAVDPNPEQQPGRHSPRFAEFRRMHRDSVHSLHIPTELERNADQLARIQEIGIPTPPGPRPDSAPQTPAPRLNGRIGAVPEMSEEKLATPRPPFPNEQNG